MAKRVGERKGMAAHPRVVERLLRSALDVPAGRLVARQKHFRRLARLGELTEIVRWPRKFGQGVKLFPLC